MRPNAIRYADDDITPLGHLIRMRFPSLTVGVVLGLLLSFITSRFEQVLASDIRLAYFIPFVVYVAEATGSQTQTIYTRDLATGKTCFKKYLAKETLLGLILGLAFGLITAIITHLWFSTPSLTLSVSLSMLVATSTAPLISLLITEIFQLKHTDPAVGAGPIATIIQDTLSILIYGLIVSAVVL